MREIGRGGSGEERGAGVAVAAAVAILERQQEEQRRVKPSIVRHLQPGDLIRTFGAGVSRDSSDSSVSSVGDTVARLQSRFSGVDRSVGNSVSPPSSSVGREAKQHTDAKPGNHVNSVRRNDLPSVRKKELDNSDVKSNHVVTEKEECFNDIRKSPSTKNISSLVRNNSVVSTLNNAPLSSFDSKTQDVQKFLSGGTPVGAAEVDIPFRSGSTQCRINDSKGSSGKQQFVSKLSTGNDSSRRGKVQRSSSATEALDQHDRCDDDDGLGASCARNDTLQNDDQLQNLVKGSTNDSNIPRKRPRVIHLRESASEKGSRTKSNPELASERVVQQTQLQGAAESADLRSSGRIVLEYPSPPHSLPPEDEDHSGSPVTGGSSPSSSQRILASSESLGSYTHTGRAGLDVSGLISKKFVCKSGLLNFAHRPYFNKIITLRKLDFFRLQVKKEGQKL
jgi:hypothetical protein